MKPALSITIRIEGELSLIERMRDVIIPDFKSIILDENFEIREEKAVWKIKLTADTISRLRALTNSILRAASLYLEIEGILEEKKKEFEQ